MFAVAALNGADDGGRNRLWRHFAGAASGGHASGDERRDDFLYLDVRRGGFGLVTQGAGEVAQPGLAGAVHRRAFFRREREGGGDVDDGAPRVLRKQGQQSGGKGDGCFEVERQLLREGGL